MCDCGLQLQAYLDGELDFSQRAELEAHLAACADCATELTKLRKLSKLIQAYEPVLPAGVMARMYEAIEDASGRMLIRLVARLTAAAAVLLLGGSLWLVSQTPRANTDVAQAQNNNDVVLPAPWEHAAVALNADPSPDVQFASLVLADTSNVRGQ
jgi:anti-sigma factor RsiW